MTPSFTMRVVSTGRPPVWALVLLLFVGQLHSMHACPLEIWTFDSIEACGFVSQNIRDGAPVSKGTIVADGACRTAQVLESTLQPPGFQLPGTYSAFCIRSTTESPDFGVVQVWESGCIDSACGRNLDSSPPNTCDRDYSTPAFLYSRVNPPGEIVVQDPSLRITGYFQCKIVTGGLTSNVLSLAFAVFGDCNCQNQTPTIPETNSPTIMPTFKPTIMPTSEPTIMPTSKPTMAQTSTPTSAPVTTATTEATTEGTQPATTDATTVEDSAPATTVAPPTQSPPVTSPSQPDNPVLRPTPAPTNAQTTSPQTPTDSPRGGNTSQASATAQSDSSSSLVPTIAGAAAAGAFFVGLAAFMVWYFSKRKPKSNQIAKDHKSIEDGTPLPASFSTQSPPPHSSSHDPAATRVYPEIICSPSDDISTLGEPMGMDWQNQLKSDESTASVSMSYIRNVLLQGHGAGGYMYASEGDMASRTEASAMSSSMTEIDPDKFLPPEDDEESFENVFHQAFTSSKKENVIRFQINVPPGRLGMLLDATDGIPTVNQIKPDSIFAHQNVKVGDFLVAVDGIDVRGMEPIDVSQLIVMKARQARRVFIFERIKQAGHEVDRHEDVQV